MITQLTVKNFGLIDSMSVEFEKGLNILTGETGAGKSILIDALRYSLGERLDSAQVRDPQQPCMVEAVFDLPKNIAENSDEIKEYLSGEDRTFIINRAYSPDGRNKIKINGLNATLAQLKSIGDRLVDLHGPHDHQMLLSASSHIGILDSLCVFTGTKERYSQKFGEYTGLKRKQDEIRESAASRLRDLELLSHQIKELERVPLETDKYEELLNAQKRLSNSEKLYECATQLIDILENEENGLSGAIGRAFEAMRTLVSLDPSMKDLSETLNTMQGSTESLLSGLRDYSDKLSFEPSEIKDINERCDAYYDIIRKYGPTLDDAKAFYDKAKKRHDFLEDLEQNETDISKEITACEKEISKLAADISKERTKTAKQLKTTIEKELKELGILHVKFECRVTRAETPLPTGFDEVNFYISPNAGEEMKPLSEIVSSGEAARVMLALKKALTKVDPIPVLIFDEIDSQIGGRLGDILGRKLRELSSNRQVVLITHLPQIAGYADRHYKVSKSVEKNRTVTKVTLLDKEERVKEMAKMMSGENETGISVTHAREMLSRAKTAR